MTCCVDKTDKRNKIVALTPKAVKKWKELRSTVEQNEKRMLEGLSQEQINEFVAVLSKIYDNLETKRENYV